VLVEEGDNLVRIDPRPSEQHESFSSRGADRFILLPDRGRFRGVQHCTRTSRNPGSSATCWPYTAAGNGKGAHEPPSSSSFRIGRRSMRFEADDNTCSGLSDGGLVLAAEAAQVMHCGFGVTDLGRDACPAKETMVALAIRLTPSSTIRISTCSPAAAICPTSITTRRGSASTCPERPNGVAGCGSTRPSYPGPYSGCTTSRIGSARRSIDSEKAGSFRNFMEKT
jgi:hypothetical protein